MKDQKGVSIKCSNMGDTLSLEYLVPAFPNVSNYFKDFIKHLTNNYGYKKSDTIFGAPYDFRKIGDIREMMEYFTNLRNFIENIVKCKQSKVIFVSHSLGSVLVSHFLKNESKKWKNIYIDSWYSIAGAFGGSVQSVMCFLRGIPFFIPRFISLNKIKTMYTSFPSCCFLLPSAKVFGPENIFVSTENKQYSAVKLKKLIEDHVTNDIHKIFQFVPNIFIEESPGVDTVCVYSYGLSTLAKIEFEGNIEDSIPFEIYGDGDETLLTESMAA
ncbi:hypothetical protein HZS_4975, partial [Henneguya salminicola]